MTFKRLKLSDWRQFGKIDIEFDPRLTILTGANGSGKTAILRLLAVHFGWQFQDLAVPYMEPGLQGIQYRTAV